MRADDIRPYGVRRSHVGAAFWPPAGGRLNRGTRRGGAPPPTGGGAWARPPVAAAGRGRPALRGTGTGPDKSGPYGMFPETDS